MRRGEGIAAAFAVVLAIVAAVMVLAVGYAETNHTRAILAQGVDK